MTKGSAPLVFGTDVAPIVHGNCTGCHYEGGPAPFALETYAEVRDHAEQIVEVVEAGLMPPWLPEPGFGGPFVGQRGLDEAQRQVLAAWFRAGSLPGDLAGIPSVPPRASGWQLGQPDLVLEAASSFELPAEGRDVYQNFVIPLGAALGQPQRWIRAVELQPGEASVVHHAVLRVDGSSEAVSLGGELGSFEGMVVDAQMPGGRFVGWTPGKVPDPGSDARAWPLSREASLVFQLHLRPSGKPERLRPKLGLYFARPGVQPRPSLALILSSTDIDIPAGAPAYELEDRFELPAAVDVHSIYPHAHYLAKQVEAFATLPSGERRWLVKISDWDFNWQDEYRLVSPLRLPAGTVLTMRHVYDNSAQNPRNPHAPPRRVQFGPASTDEMAELIVEASPVDPRAMPALQQALREKWMRVQLATARRAVEQAPRDASAHAELASLLSHGGDARAAASEYALALSLLDAKVISTQRAAMRIDYAIVLIGLAQFEGARAELDTSERLLAEGEIEGESRGQLAARTALVRGDLEREAGALEAAREAYVRAGARDPQNAVIDDKLGHTLQALGRLPPACEAFAAAVAKAPGTLAYREHLARALEADGQFDAAREAYEAALALDPNAPRSLRGLAWVFATHSDPQQRDPKRAIMLAEQAGKLVGFRSPEVFEALAAGLAGDGQFALAGQAIARGIELARVAQREDLAARYVQQAARYAKGQSL